MNIGRANSERHIYNNTDISNTDLNNTDFSDTDFNLSVSPAQTHEKTDRQTDRFHSNSKMTFSDILSEIGISNENIERMAYYTDKDSISALSESDLSEFDDGERKVQNCTIPYSLSNNQKAMKEALKYLFSYSYYINGMEEENKRFLNNVISSIAEMTEKDTQIFQKQIVKYYEIIDRLNDILHSSDSSLIDWFYSFQQEWTKILAENKIKYPKAYMKSCIWNWLNDYQFEEDNDLMALDYRLNNQAYNHKKTEMDKYAGVINKIPDIPEKEENDDTVQEQQENQGYTQGIAEYRESFIETIIKTTAKENNKPVSYYLPKGSYKILGNDGNYYVLDDNGEYCPFDEKIGVSA